MTYTPVADRQVEQWYRDPISCLQSTIATLLIRVGADPLDVLGLHWGFRYLPGDVVPVEYYLPCDDHGDLVGSLLPHHPVSSTWRTAPDDAPVAALEDALATGGLPIVAVDNYYLRFRPAYQDLHSGHLIVVYDVDQANDVVQVSDAMPPAYQGKLAIHDLVRSWRSGRPPDEQNAFFSGGGPHARWLDVHIRTPLAELTPDRLGTALRDNVRGFTEPDDGRNGFDGLTTFATQLVEWAAAGDGDNLATAYTFGWSAQAQAALHGELLRRCGARWRLPALAEAGRLAERVAHLWTPVRVTAARRRDRPRDALADLQAHTRALRTTYHSSVDAIAGISSQL